MPEIDNWVQEKTATVGQGDIILSPSDDSSLVAFAAAFPSVSTIWYSVKDGDNREAGRGTFNGINRISRTTVDATFFNGVYDVTSPQPIALSGDAVVSCTFNAKAFRDLENAVAPSVSAKESSSNYVSAGGVALNLTGLTIRVSAGSGVIVDSYTNPSSPVITNVSWLQQDILITSGLSRFVSVYISPAGLLVQSDGIVSAQDDRNNLLIAHVQNNFVTARIIDARRKANYLSNAYGDYINFIGADFKSKGMEVLGTSSGLSVYVKSGSIFSIGANESNDIKSPNIVPLPQLGDSSNAAVITYFLSDGSRFLSSSVISKNYEITPSVNAPLTGSEASISYLYQNTLGDLVCQYGSNKYPSTEAAILALCTDRADHIRFNGSDAFTLLAQIYFNNNSTGFSDPLSAGIINMSTTRPFDESEPKFDLKVQTDDSIPHLKNTIASIGGWLGYALKDTEESPAPQEFLKTEESIDTSLSFLNVNTSQIVEMVHVYNITQSGYIKNIRVRLPSLDADTMSKVSLINETSGDEHLYSGPVLSAAEFSEVGRDLLFARKGDVVRLSVLIFDAPLNLYGSWNADRTPGGPLSGEVNINFLVNPTRLIYSNTDSEGVDESANLAAVGVGSIVSLAEEGHANRRLLGIINSVNAATGVDVEFLITQIYNSELLIRPGKKTITEIYDAPTTNAQFNKINSFFATDNTKFANIQSEIYFSGVKQLNTDDAYGISISYQPAYISPDWLVLGKGGL